jgi:hypothetical protein
MKEGDPSGTPVAFVEGRRQQGFVRALDVLPNHVRVSHHLIWGDDARKQTGYAKALVDKDGVVWLYEKLIGGATLPQVAVGASNHQQALDQKARRERLTRA